MDLDDLLPKRADDPLAALRREDLDRLSVDELRARAAALRAEADRTEAKLGAATAFKSEAEKLFRR